MTMQPIRFRKLKAGELVKKFDQVWFAEPPPAEWRTNLDDMERFSSDYRRVRRGNKWRRPIGLKCDQASMLERIEMRKINAARKAKGLPKLRD